MCLVCNHNDWLEEKKERNSNNNNNNKIVITIFGFVLEMVDVGVAVCVESRRMPFECAVVLCVEKF